MSENSRRQIDLDRTVFETCSEFPEVKDLMAGLGFDEITKPGRLQTMGRFMTLRKGAGHKGVDLDAMVAAFQKAGFEVAGFEPATASEPVAASEPAVESEPAAASGPAAASEPVVESEPAADPDPVATTPEQRQELLKSLLVQLQQGASIDDVREEFAQNFKDVDGS